MAEERPSPTQPVLPVTKDPVFLLMVSGQIESAEVTFNVHCRSRSRYALGN